MSGASTALVVLRLLVSLGAVLALVVWIARYAAKRGLGGARLRRSGVALDVLSRRSLGRTSSVQVVQVGRRTLVLGVTEHGVSVLGELAEEDFASPEAPIADQGVARSQAHGFEQALASAQGVLPFPAPQPVATGSSPHGVAARIPVPEGWPWSAASFVLKQVQARRG